MLIYVAGPYRGDVEKNVATAKQAAAELWKAGHAVICPHGNTYNILPEKDPDWDFWKAGDFDILSRCDGIVLLPGWENSVGSCDELAYACELGIPHWEYPMLPPLHPTEVQSPKQAKAFREEIGRLYRTHLDKNADYSPANILATGEIGLTTRLWDKIARLMNLMGFRVQIASSTFESPRDPKNESIEDTLRDAACYSIIGLLLRRGVWGK